MPLSRSCAAVRAGPKKGALVYPKRPFRGIHNRKHLVLHQAEKIHQFVADQTGIEREERCEKKTCPKTIEKPGLREENQDENAKRRHCQLDTREKRGSLGHDCVHHGIGFDHALVHELQRQECIGARQQHGAGCKKEQPGVMPVEKYDFVIGSTSMSMPT